MRPTRRWSTSVLVLLLLLGGCSNDYSEVEIVNATSYTAVAGDGVDQPQPPGSSWRYAESYDSLFDLNLYIDVTFNVAGNEVFAHRYVSPGLSRVEFTDADLADSDVLAEPVEDLVQNQ